MGGEGERLHAQRRRHFWLTIAGLVVIGFIGGLVGSYIRRLDAGAVATPGIVWLAAAGVIILAVAALFASWKFFVSVDEVEVADNLWGSLVGFYAYATLLPVWWALSKLGLVVEPNHWAIYGVSLVTAFLAYAYRKWQFS